MTGVWAVIAHRTVLFVLAGVAVGLTACADDGPGPRAQPPALVAVETQRCRQPNRFSGVGIVVADDFVLTAGHTVEGDLRELTVDGTPARVVAIERRTDLALLSAATPSATPPTPAPRIPEAATLLGDDVRDVDIDRHVTLVVEHATDQATYERDVVFFSPGVTDGDSGSPLVDEAGRLIGIVVADQDGEGVAVTIGEITTMLETTTTSDDLGWPDPPGAC